MVLDIGDRRRHPLRKAALERFRIAVGEGNREITRLRQHGGDRHADLPGADHQNLDHARTLIMPEP